jgi:hypothetical protein
MTFWISPMKRVRMRLTTNAGASFTSTAVFFSFLATAKAVASEASSVASPRTISRSGRIATGLKKWKPTTRSGFFSFDAISETESEEVLVARIACAGATASTSANTCCLTPISSKTASMMKSASEKPSALSSTPVTRALQAVGLVLVDTGLQQQLVDLGVDVAHTLVDALLVDVGQHDRHLQAAQEEQGELRGHQTGADDADLGDRAGQGLVRGTRRTLAALLHQVERVDAGAQFATHDQVGEGHVLGVVTLLQVAVLGRGDDVQRAVRGRGRAVHLAVRDERPLATAWSQASPRSIAGRSTSTRP